MSTKLIKTKDYILLLDLEAEIKEGDYILEKELIINIFPDYLTDLDECSKITAYYPLTKEAEKLDLPLLPPFEEVDIDNKSELKILLEKRAEENNTCDLNEYALGLLAGYKAATKQFSLEDIIAFGKKCFYKGFDKSENDDANSFTAWREECSKLIQSLSTQHTQQLPISFEPEYEEVASAKWGYGAPCDYKLKTITNSEGKEELVGTYQY